MKNTRRDFIKLSSACLSAPFSVVETTRQYKPEPPAVPLAENRVENYTRWLWIELIGFDNTSADFGVAQFLRNAGFIPEAISFLITSPDFVHGHRGMADEWVFPEEFCSYNARPVSAERKRQEWTNLQLKGLVRTLRQQGVAVYCSFFDFFVNRPAPGRWAYNHPEICETGRDGDRYPFIHPLKRFKDGSYYEDLFVEKLTAVLKDYEFDGYHGADGYTSGRRPLNDVDYTDDMIGQFTAATGAQLSPGLSGKLDGDKKAFGKRSRWIWRHLRKEWIGFHTDRWTGFWKKVITAVHSLEKKVVFNTAWTRDPFEAIYRYGVDYRRIAALGLDGFIVEAVASAVAMEPELSDEYTKFYYNALAMILLIKARCPEAALRPFTQIHDTTEQYDALRHVSTFVEREIGEVANLYVTGPEGKPVRCSSGPMCCLSDSVEAHEWRWLKVRWDLGFSDLPEAVQGVTLVWSDAALHNQLDVYIQTRRPTVHKWLYELLAMGAPVASAVRVEALNQAAGPLLVLNPELLPADELKRVLSYTKGPLLMIGNIDAVTSGQRGLRFTDPADPAVGCLLLHADSNVKAPVLENSVAVRSAEAGDTSSGQEDPESWTRSLYFKPFSETFVRACATLMKTVAGGVEVLSKNADAIKVTTLVFPDKRRRLLIGNDSFYYVTPVIKMPGKIREVTVKTPFPGVPVGFTGSEFRVRVPGRGIVVLDVLTD